MAETNQELSAEETERLELVESDETELDRVVGDLSVHSRRKRQFAARVIRLLAERDPERVAPYIDDLVEALELSEAQTRWEVLDTLNVLVETHGKEVGAAFEGAETALFDEDSPTLRYSAFRLLCTWGATDRGRSKKVWPIIDEAIQCYHGDMEYRDMLGCLHDFASGKIEGGVAEQLAQRLRFDAENGKGVYLKSRSGEICEMLVKRFKIDTSKKKSGAKVSKDSADNAESEE